MAGIACLNAYNRFTPKNCLHSCMLIGRVSIKITQGIVEFKILDFYQFCFVLVNMGPNGISPRIHTPTVFFVPKEL